MNTVLENLSIVVIAKDFNISIFKPFWLMKNKIFHEEEFQGNILITPPAVQIPTDNFQFVLLPDRLQMSMHRQYPDAKSDIDRIVGGIVKTLPQTPYTAVGINFNYLIAPEDEDVFSSWNRKLFACPLSDKIQSPKENNARFGSYFSLDVLGTRLKIDVRPIKALPNIENLFKSWHVGQDLMRAHFNFHSDIINVDSPSDSVLDKLNKWPDALALSQQTIDTICE